MPTIPFIQVQGAIALPCPLERMPPPFGREWALLPPHFSLRAELKALYAALLRTVCLSAEAFHAVCRWDRHHLSVPQPVAAPGAPVSPGRAAAPATRPARATPPAARSNHAPAITPAQPSFQTGLRAPRPPLSPDTRRRMGWACAAGGTALLAWIVASHAPHESRAPVTAAVPPPPAALPAQAATSPSSPPLRQQPASPHTDTVPPDLRTRRNRNVPPRTAADNRHAHPPAKPSIHPRSLRVPHGGMGRPAVRGHAPHRATQPVAPHRARGVGDAVDTTANRYAPRQPAASQYDQYDPIVTYAATHTAAHPGNGRPAIPTDSVEWVNHVSQRRVTEIPDRFSK